MSRTTARRVTTLTLLAALTLSACGSASGEEGGSEFRFPVTATIPTLDPHVSPSGVVAEIDRHIFETLVAYDTALVPQPALAEAWETEDDGATWTFHLRDDVTFHNGDPLTAEDVAASLNKWKRTTARAQTFMGESEFSVVDDLTVELALDSPRGDVLDQLANPLQFAAIMPASVIENAAAEGVTEYVGTGPYEFVEWAPDQHVHVARYEGYVGSEAESDGLSGKKNAHTENLYFDFITDTSTRFSMFLAGDYDVVDVNADQLPQVEAQTDVDIATQLATGFNVVFNMQSPIFSELLNREAVAAAIDADDFMLAVVSDPELYRLNPSYAFHENEVWWSDAGSEGVYNQGDSEKAAALVSESGYDGEEVR
ncbi:MAG TPA: ABC transporter substrate-binding protein, partial [Actinomycetaceae bacterium]|nr:ABC transporter substrate-binding protein [Actinomycetaceae bacterium]